MTSQKRISQKSSGKVHLEIQLNVTCRGQAPGRNDQSCIPKLLIVKALITMNSFSPDANTLHYSIGILFQMVINGENRELLIVGEVNKTHQINGQHNGPGNGS
jgi:hypothetical protein